MRFSLVLVPLCTLSALAVPVSQPEATANPFFAAPKVNENTLTNQAAAELGVVLSQANKAFQNLIGVIFDRVPDSDALENQLPAAPSTAISKRDDHASSHHKKSDYPGPRASWTFEGKKSKGTTCEVLCKGEYCACRAKGHGGNSAKCAEEFFAKYSTAKDAADVWDD